MGCDVAFRLDPVELPPQRPDASIDAPTDAPTILTCATSPIILRPTGAYTEAWTEQVPSEGTHLDKVIDADGADEDASYIASNVDGQLDLYTHLPIDSAVSIVSVTVWARARLEDIASSTQVGPAFFHGAMLEWDDVVVTSAWADHASNVYLVSPFTEKPWTVDEVNALTFGVRKAYATHRVRVTQLWVSVACN